MAFYLRTLSFDSGADISLKVAGIKRFEQFFKLMNAGIISTETTGVFDENAAANKPILIAGSIIS